MVYEINAKGQRCPRPIIELAKAKRSMGSGGEIRIIADDPAFESDVRAWCETTGADLVEFKKEEGDIVTALIKLK